MLEQLSLFEETFDFRQHKKYLDGLFKSKDEIIKELHEQGKDKIYKILSFGAGTQSSHLFEEMLQDRIHYDAVIMSDVGAEPDFIHSQVKWWQKRQQELGNTTPFIITGHNSMNGGLEEMLMRYIHSDYQRLQLPLHLTGLDEETGEITKAGMLPRQCTVDFKITPVEQTSRKLILEDLGLKPKQRIPSNVAIIMDLGFSNDEIKRINRYQSPRSKYIYYAYPLVEEGLSTIDSIQFLKDNQFPSKRSRCYFCPFNCDDRETGMDWEEIIRDEPLSFLKACFFDEEVRMAQRRGDKVLRSVPYFHYSRQPLKEVYKEEFNQLMIQYQKDFFEWKNKWQAYVYVKHIA